MKSFEIFKILSVDNYIEKIPVFFAKTDFHSGYNADCKY